MIRSTRKRGLKGVWAMEYRRLGKSGLEVSDLALGTMQFGWSADGATALSILDPYREASGNLIIGANSVERLRENPSAVGFRLAEEERELLGALSEWREA